ncbi:PREDICTED: uncharacterized protein LOC103328357 [Prunus mume]|uniref:Uncharacterized protein LOC103328357 n=1 Tax=Prunus mume TaxID=102107 RepID=A0ABM0NS25_PRUMU|nr:PREDICTED: uncharacterized protein LOC103328357 [Prunus mume]
MDDYLCERPLYPPVDLCKWFDMRIELFYRILNDVVAHKLAILYPEDRRFSNARIWMLAVYGQWYLRSLNSADLYMLLHKELKNCPTAWASQFTCYKHKPIVVLEAVASYDTWIWHAFLGIAGSNNDIIWVIIWLMVSTPRWATLVKTISRRDTPKQRLFAQKQEAYRKDVERALGILQAQWAIVRGPAHMWRKEQLHSIMMTCIILHNMIVEDEYEDLDAESDDEDNCPRTSRRARARLAYELEPTITYDINRDRQTISNYMVRHNRVRASQVHHNLRNDLINHIWRCEGEGP